MPAGFACGRICDAILINVSVGACGGGGGGWGLMHLRQLTFVALLVLPVAESVMPS